MVTSLFAITAFTSPAESQQSDRDELAEHSGDVGYGSVSEEPDDLSDTPGEFKVKELDTKQELIDEGLSNEEASAIIDIQNLTEKM